MSLYRVPESDMRDECKRTIEALELWLRRLIDDKLSETFGSDYLSASRADGPSVIGGKLAHSLLACQSQDPKRFARPIDAALLEDEISIVCNPELYKRCFREALSSVFPDGNDAMRTVLRRLVAARNTLSHANPLSVHDAYRVLCYSMDVIEGLKNYYAEINMSQSYNVPTVVRVWDSLGHEVYLSGANRDADGPVVIDYSRDDSAHLRCGDSISIEVNVDPTFDPQDYDIRWGISEIGDPNTPGTSRFHLHLTERHVSTMFGVVCRVVSKKSWHKLQTCDDQIEVRYRVLPPP